jgi:hypothetical protein
MADAAADLHGQLVKGLGDGMPHGVRQVLGINPLRIKVSRKKDSLQLPDQGNHFTPGGNGLIVHMGAGFPILVRPEDSFGQSGQIRPMIGAILLVQSALAVMFGFQLITILGFNVRFKGKGDFRSVN